MDKTIREIGVMAVIIVEQLLSPTKQKHIELVKESFHFIQKSLSYDLAQNIVQIQGQNTPLYRYQMK